MSRNTLVVLVIVIVALLVGIWWVQSQKRPTVLSPTPSASPFSEAPKESSPASAMTGEVREIKVSASEFAFSPPTLSIKAGEKVRITFQNNGKLPHNLTVDKLGLATKTIGPGQTDTQEVTAGQSGTFVMYCSVDAHRQKGLEGSIKVE